MKILINSAINYINKRKRLMLFSKNVNQTKKYESVDNREDGL